jgi:murein DD-endopeptidase MepM/ murein hydrolase activator NlpD
VITTKRKNTWYEARVALVAACASTMGTTASADPMESNLANVCTSLQHSPGDDAIAECQTSRKADAAKITFGKVPDLEGRPIYGHQADFSGAASVLTLSTRQPPARPGRFAVPPAEPLGTVTALPAAKAPRRSTPIGAVMLPRYFPVAVNSISSGFGVRAHPILGVTRVHQGVDLAVPAGTPVAATANGQVVFAGWSGGYGLMIAIDHGNGVETRYGHMERLAARVGTRLRAGDVLGSAGSTGLSTGPHVHYEVRVGGVAVSPFGVR